MFLLPEATTIINLRQQYEDKKNAFITKVISAAKDKDIPMVSIEAWLQLCVGDTRLISEILTEIKKVR